MKNIAICMTTDRDTINTLKGIKDIIDLSETHVSIISIIKLNVITFNVDPYIFPQEIHYEVIRNETLKIMHELGDSLSLDSSQISYDCEFDFNPKEYVHSILKKTNMDLLVIASREKHGLKGIFTGSFMDYFIKFSPCDVMVMRPK